MNSIDIIKEYLSTCSGKIMNVYYELYGLIEQIDEEQQPAAIKYFCENIDTIDSDSSYEITKNYYSDDQLKRISHKFHETDLHGKIDSLADTSSRQSLPPIDFYGLLWNSLKKTYRTKRERALLLYEMSQNSHIPYRAIGTGLSMSNEEFKKILSLIGEDLVRETEYMLDLNYEQKTQLSSLLVDRIIKLDDRKKQSVYMAMLIQVIEQNIKSSLREILE